MRTIAILPVKSFNAAKQRLAGLLGAGSRQALAQAMFSDVLTSLRHVPGLDAVAVVTSDRVAESAALGERVQVLRDTEQAGQSEASLIGIRYAQAAGYERVLLVPGDTPLVEPDDVVALLELDAPRGDRSRPPRHRHQRAADHTARRDRPELWAGQLRAPRGRGPRTRFVRVYQDAESAVGAS